MHPKHHHGCITVGIHPCFLGLVVLSFMAVIVMVYSYFSDGVFLFMIILSTGGISAWEPLKLFNPASDGFCPQSFNCDFFFQYLFQAKNKPPSLTSAHNPNDPFDDEERERLQVEALAKKFENKYVSYFYSLAVFCSGTHLIM